MDRHAAFDEVTYPNSWQILHEHQNLAGRPLKPGVIFKIKMPKSIEFFFAYFSISFEIGVLFYLIPIAYLLLFIGVFIFVQIRIKNNPVVLKFKKKILFYFITKIIGVVFGSLVFGLSFQYSPWVYKSFVNSKLFVAICILSIISILIVVPVSFVSSYKHKNLTSVFLVDGFLLSVLLIIPFEAAMGI